MYAGEDAAIGGRLFHIREIALPLFIDKLMNRAMCLTNCSNGVLNIINKDKKVRM